VLPKDGGVLLEENGGVAVRKLNDRRLRNESDDLESQMF